MRVSDAGPSVHVEKLALMALYTPGRSVLAREIRITRAIVKLVASVSFSDTRRKKAIAVLACRHFIRRDAFTIVWKHVCSPGIIFGATSSRYYPFFKTNFVTRASLFFYHLLEIHPDHLYNVEQNHHMLAQADGSDSEYLSFHSYLQIYKLIT